MLYPLVDSVLLSVREILHSLSFTSEFTKLASWPIASKKPLTAEMVTGFVSLSETVPP